MSSEAKHTPGHWFFLEEGRTEEDGNRYRPLTISCGDEDLANIYSSDDSFAKIPREQAIANARLIAAGPELLEALRLVLSRFDFGEQFPDDHPIFAARAVLAKATGAQK